MHRPWSDLPARVFLEALRSRLFLELADLDKSAATMFHTRRFGERIQIIKEQRFLRQHLNRPCCHGGCLASELLETQLLGPALYPVWEHWCLRARCSGTTIVPFEAQEEQDSSTETAFCSRGLAQGEHGWT